MPFIPKSIVRILNTSNYGTRKDFFNLTMGK